MARSFIALTHVDLGIQPKRIFSADIHFPRGRYTKVEEKRAFFERLLPQLSAAPGVISATELIGLPPLFAPRSDVTIPGKPHREEWTTDTEMCSEGYFQTLGLHLLQGRLLTADNISAARKVAVVNEALARKYFPGEDAIGQIKFNVMDQLPESPHDAYFEIVGVVNDSPSFDFDGETAVQKLPGWRRRKRFCRTPSPASEIEESKCRLGFRQSPSSIRSGKSCGLSTTM